jgi:hypothetical protein
MALPGLTQHRKFGRLARALGSRVLAMGVLELLWSHAYDVVDATIGDATDLAYILDWPTDPAAVIEALQGAGFIDEIAPGQYAVHDLWDHCPQYVRRRRARAEARTNPSVSQPGPGATDLTALPGQASPDQERKSSGVPPRSHPVENANDDVPNPRLLARLGFEVAKQPCESEADFREELKCAAGQHHLPYDGPSITRAADLVLRTNEKRAPLMARGHEAPRRAAAGDG